MKKQHLGYLVNCPICHDQHDVYYKRDANRLKKLYRRLIKVKARIFELEDDKSREKGGE
jgi:hypothetical protein